MRPCKQRQVQAFVASGQHLPYTWVLCGWLFLAPCPLGSCLTGNVLAWGPARGLG